MNLDINLNKTKHLESHEIFRTLVSAVIEHVLLSINITSHDLVNEELKKHHGISIDDVFVHPEKLQLVLIHLYGDSYDAILKKIKNVFGSSLDQTPIFNFVLALEK